jgi:hypothetical protein
MVDESDGISEAFEGQLRVAVTAAGRVGEIIARQHEEAARRAQAASMQEANELTSRMNAERQSARTEYGQVYRSEWWERATPQDIGSTLATAHAWVHEDPEAVRAETRMSDELRTRYGVDVDQAGGDPQAVQAAVDAEVQRRQVEANRPADASQQQSGVAAGDDPSALLEQVAAAERSARDARYRADFGNEGPEKSADQAQAQQSAGAANDARSELRSRYGIDLSETAGDYNGTRAAVDAELLRLNGDTERQRSRTEESEAALLMRQADEADRRAEAANVRADNAPEGSGERTQARKEARSHEKTAESARADYGPKYDSAERRENDANKLAAKGLQKEAVAAKMHADLGNAKPATDAVKGASANATKAKLARSAGLRVQRSEPGR